MLCILSGFPYRVTHLVESFQIVVCLAAGISCGGIAVACGRTGILWMKSKSVAVYWA